MTQEDFVTFEQAKQLKKLGFDWETNAFYSKDGDLYSSNNPDYWNNDIWNEHSAPTLSLVQKWLREVKGIDVHYHYGRTKWTYYWGRRWSQSMFEEEYDTPLEALYGGIDRVIKYLMEENKQQNN